jgi:hypothetical protein
MLERRELSEVTANSEFAGRLLATARQHLASVRLLAASGPYLAYAAGVLAKQRRLDPLICTLMQRRPAHAGRGVGWCQGVTVMYWRKPAPVAMWIWPVPTGLA